MEIILESTYSLHHKCHFMNVSDGEALPFFSLDFELDFQEERKCDGIGAATGFCWCSADLKERDNEKKGVHCLVQTSSSAVNFWEGALVALQSWSRRSGEGMNERICSHLGLLCLCVCWPPADELVNTVEHSYSLFSKPSEPLYFVLSLRWKATKPMQSLLVSMCKC